MAESLVVCARSLSVFRLPPRATGSSSASEPGHSASVFTSSEACVSDSSPAAAAARVSGMASSARAVSRAVRASPIDVPEVRASQSAASANPFCRWAPHSAARAAARARAVEQAFSVAARTSATAAASSPV
ncbi:MAG: hypothetical protein ACRDZ3_09830 [Acidimicrobiia bacterium]